MRGAVSRVAVVRFVLFVGIVGIFGSATAV